MKTRILTLLFPLLCSCLFLTFFTPAHASVLAIDYGTDQIKAVLLAPGVPFDILLDRSSKRKVQAAVAWKRDERVFGVDVAGIASRFPRTTYTHLKPLLGAPPSSSAASFHASIAPAVAQVPTERGTIAFKRPSSPTEPDAEEWTVEELVAMQLSYIRGLADEQLGPHERVTSVVLTVPPFFTQHERDALISAAEIAGMRVEGLVNDGTAVAVNYAMTRVFPFVDGGDGEKSTGKSGNGKENSDGGKEEIHVIYDAGAGAVRATVVGFSSFAPSSSSGKSSKNAKKETPGTQIRVLGVGWDRAVGGAELDRRVRDMLVEDFAGRYAKKGYVRSDERAMAKLWKEAGRVRAILSANAEAGVTIESLAFDIDYRAKLTRTQFEGACKDLQLRFAKPIFDALNSAGLGLDDVTSVILTGGASRTPMIQAAVKAAVGESKIALNVNADEAAALGAGLYTAGLSRAYRAKEYRIFDSTPYDIQSAYASEKASDSAKPPRTIHTTLFGPGSRLGTKKTLSMKRTEDFDLRLEYKSAPVAGYPTDLVEASISGVPDALQNLTEAGAQNPVVKVTVALTESGLVSVSEAVMHGEIKDESLTGKLKSFLGAGAGSTSSETESETPLAGEGQTDGAKDAKEDATPEIEAPKKKAPVKDTISLQVTLKSAPSLSMSKAEKRSARDRLLAIDYAEAEKQLAEAERNTLEGYLYRVRDLLEEEGETPFMKCSKEPERTEMRRKLDETFAWLHDHGDHATTHNYISRRTELEKLEHPIMHRYTEIQEWPRALNQSQMWNWSTRMFITEAKLALEKEAEGGDPARHSAEDIAALEKTLIEHEIWLNDAVERQKKVTMYDDPAVESAELRKRAKVLENHLQRIAKRKVPKRKTTASKAKSETASAGTSSTSAAKAEETTPAGHRDEL